MNPRKTDAKASTAETDTSIDTSAIPKKAHRKPEIRYIAGLNKLTVCHALGNISIE